MKRDRRIKAAFYEERQYIIELAPGWSMIDGEHQIMEDTRQEARSRLVNVEKCDCAECLEMLADEANRAREQRAAKHEVSA
jgi:hypothetical protein